MKFSVENKVINALGFQAIWWSLALFKAQAVFFCLVLIVLHFGLMKKDKWTELVFVLMISFLGIVMDSTLMNFNFISFSLNLPSQSMLVPFWYMLVWVGFSTTLNFCLSWIFKNKLISFFIGGIGGALSYLAADRLGAISLSKESDYTIIWLTVTWALFFLLINLFRTKFNKVIKE